MTAPDDIKENIRGIIAEVSEIDEIPDGAEFKDLGIDSMTALEIVAEVERTYKIFIPEGDLTELTSFDRVVAYVQRLKGDSSSLAKQAS